jgi:hypothetical protein
MTGPTSPARIPDGALVPTALATTESVEDVDAETMISVLAAMRRHEIGVAVGAAIPPLLGCVLLYLGGEVGVAVPAALLAGVGALSIATVPLLIWWTRRAFIAECVSLGLSPALAKRLHRRSALAAFKFEREQRQEDRDRARAALLLTP